MFDVREASSDDDTMHTAEPGYVTFESDGSSVYTDAPLGLTVDMESDDDVSGDEPDGCEAEDAPAEAPSGASVDATPTQPEGEAFAASSSTQMHLPVWLWTWNPMVRALATKDGCEAEAAPTEAPLGAAFDVPLAAQPEGESPQLLHGPSQSAI